MSATSTRTDIVMGHGTNNKWLQVLFGVGPGGSDSIGSRLIHPMSSFGMWWAGLAAFFLGINPAVHFHDFTQRL